MRPTTILWALFGFDGRVNREVYWLGNLFVSFVAVALVMPKIDETTGAVAFGPLFPVVGIFLLWSEIALSVKRLHDRNLSGWFSLVYAVPFLGVLAFFVIGLIPGDPGPNQFGRAANQRG